MATKMLRVVLITCVFFTNFECGRTLETNLNDRDDAGHINEGEQVLHRVRRAPPRGPNGAVMPALNNARQQQLPLQQQAGQGFNPNAAAGVNPNIIPRNPNPMIPHNVAPINGGQQAGGFQQGPDGRLYQNPIGNNLLAAGGAGAAPLGGQPGQGQGAFPQQALAPQAPGGGVGPAFNVGDVGRQLPLGKKLAKDARMEKKKMAAALRPVRIAETPYCSEDVRSLCGKNARGNNFAVLDCLQNARQDNSEISMGCNHFLWEYKYNLTTDSRFDSAAFEVCKEDIQKFPTCQSLERGKGHVLPCLYEVLENVTNTQCRQYLNRMKAITFSDFMLIEGFYDKCRSDIMDHKCGDVQNLDKKEAKNTVHKQGSTIHCLEKKIQVLNDDCKKQILRVAELSANDYHLDRALYFACKDDRERFCEKQQAGSGRVYKCLLKHKFEEDMSDDCKDKLTTRQQVISQDYKANYALQKKCKEEIHRNHCEGKREKDRDFRLSFLLVCLEAAKKRGRAISGGCDAELLDTRRSLMNDYLINPEVVLGCKSEIETHCGGLEREGRTLHCLMERAKQKQALGQECVQALEDLVKETDAGEDYRIDPALARACVKVKQAVCKEETGGDGKVLSCLMEHIYDPVMTPECEDELLQLQYFVSRNFKLDPLLYKNCKVDAENLCNAKEWDNDDPANGIYFACLHRNLHPAPEFMADALSPGCQAQVHRVLRQRALSVHLNPRIEAACRTELGELCTDKNKKGEEFQCLQDHFDKLKTGCKMMVGNFTTEESEDIRMNRKLMESCSPMLKRFCKEKLANQVDEGEALQCLIDHKDDEGMAEKCAAGVAHFQLIGLKDFRFNFKFKEACRKDVLSNCKGSKEKATIIQCLSTKVRDDTLNDKDHTISEDCRKQLKVELLERSENIQLDPELFKGCENDLTKLCSKVKVGNARVLECLREHKPDLSDECHRKLFNREKQQAKNPDTDFAFMHACKPMIKQFCTNFSPDQILKCLRAHKNDAVMDPKCKSVITKRQIEKNSDFRLNMELQKACRRDMPKFCKEVYDNAQGEDKEIEGKMLNCLKRYFPKSKLSQECEGYIREAIQEGAMDYRMDPHLNKACRSTVKANCMNELEETGTGTVEECLKTKLQEGKITDKQCIEEVIRILQESRADVQVDPILHKACALDIKHYCVNIPQGEGRQMSCLLEALDDRSIKLKADCLRMLKERKEMWEYAARVAPPETFNDVVAQLQASPSRNYFLLVFLAVFGTLFFGGMFCGRATKRVAAQVKNK